MSFTLQLFHAPGVRTLAQADAFFESNPPATDANRSRFSAFRDDILRVYPAYSDVDSDEVGSVWPEGWSHDLGGDAVLVFAVASHLVDENLMCHLGHAAARAGLHLLDPQEGRLYRSDATSIDMRGREQRLGTPQPPRPKPRLPKGLTVEALGDRLTAAFIARHPDLGFVASQWRGFAQLERSAGQVRQRVTLYVSLRDGEAGIGIGMQFFCPALSAAWERLLGGQVAAYLKAQRQNTLGRPDLSLHTDDFSNPPSELAKELGRSKYTFARSLPEADAVLDRFDTWFKQEGAAALERLAAPAGLARLALTDHQMDRMMQDNNLSIDEMFSRLVLIGAFDAQRKDQWMMALRDHRRRQGGARGAEVSIAPDPDTALEDLNAMIGGTAFAAETASLGAGWSASAPAASGKRIVLQLWEHPAGRGWPREWSTAMQWLAQMCEARPGPNPRFAELAARLAAHRPGLGSKDTPAGVCRLAVPEEARAEALEAARALGLSVADEEGGEVHYANGFVVTREQTYRHRLPEDVFTDPRVPRYRLKPGGDLLPLAGMMDLVCLRLDRFFRRHGYVPRPGEPGSASDASPPRHVSRAYRRSQKAGWTELEVWLIARGPVVALTVNCYGCLSEVARLHKKFIVTQGGKDDGHEHSIVVSNQPHQWMTDPQGLLGTDSGRYFIASMADLDAVLAHFTAQAEARMLPLLSAFDSAQGVDALLNAGPTPTSIFFESMYQFAGMHLVVARVARNPRFEALCEMYVERAAAEYAASRRHLFGDTVKQLRDLVAFLRAY